MNSQGFMIFSSTHLFSYIETCVLFFFPLENYILGFTIPMTLIQQALEVCTGPSEKTINISNVFKRIGTKGFF